MIGVNFIEILIKKNEIEFELAGNSIDPSSSYPSKRDQKVGSNPREMGLGSLAGSSS